MLIIMRRVFISDLITCMPITLISSNGQAAINEKLTDLVLYNGINFTLSIFLLD